MGVPLNIRIVHVTFLGVPALSGQNDAPGTYDNEYRHIQKTLSIPASLYANCRRPQAHVRTDGTTRLHYAFTGGQRHKNN